MWTIKGINDEQTACDCCGRTNLKKTVVLSNGEQEVRFGSECAARRLSCTKKEVESTVRSLEKAAREEAAKADQRRRNEEWEAYHGWLMATYGDGRSDLARHRAYRAAMAS